MSNSIAILGAGSVTDNIEPTAKIFENTPSSKLAIDSELQEESACECEAYAQVPGHSMQKIVSAVTFKNTLNKMCNNSFSKAWITCLVAGLFFFYEFIQLNAFDVINQDLRQSFALNASKISFMSSAFVWANVIFLLPAGIILDNYRVKKVIIIALIVCILGTFGFALSYNFIFATIFHACTGIGNAFCFVACVILVTRWFPPKNQALVIGIIVTMAFLGGMVAHTPFAWLNNQFGWRKAMLIDVFFGLLILFLIILIVNDKHDYASLKAEIKIRDLKNDLIFALKNKQNWFAGVYTSCLNLPIMVLCALWGGSYLIAVHKLDTITASNIVSLIFIGSILGCPLLGWLSDKHGKRKPIMFISAFITLTSCMPLISGIHLSYLALSCIFFSLGFFTSAQVLSYPLIAESNPETNTGIATGIASVIIMSGGGFGQILFGLIMSKVDSSTYNVASNYQQAMLIFPTTAIIALLAVSLLKEPRRKT